jgi:dephospho-CoA kinase
MQSSEQQRTTDHGPQTKLVIGLIGGIGAGKSAAAAEFARRGARVISADAFAHDALRDRAVRDAVVKRWGRDLLDEHGEIVRRRLGAIVFADDAQRRELEALTHPWIQRRVHEAIAAAKNDPAVRFIVLDAAIMLEAGWSAVCDKLVFVDAPREVRLKRVREQRGWTAQELEARERAQLALTEKAAQADHTLNNSAGLTHLSRQVDDLLQTWGLTPAPATESE